jgi:anaerobic magnesium-protoporphyrin IX monomethyl ester cyclase
MKHSSKVLLIHTNASGKVYQSLNSVSAIEPPIWCVMLASNLMKDYEVEILDAEADGLTPTQTAKRIVNSKSDLNVFVVYGQQPSASTQNMAGVHDVLEILNNKLKTLCVGLYPSAKPEECLEKNKCTYVAKGEGIETIRGLLNHDDRVPGLFFRLGDTIQNFERSRMVPQGKLHKVYPYGKESWELLDMKKYRTANWHSMTNDNDTQPFASIYTSLGCPYRCSFCCINAPFEKNTLRYWEPEFIIEQLEYFHSIGIKNLKIADEMFVLNKNHFLKLCKLIIRRGYDFNIWAYARVDTVREEYLDILKKAGVNWLALGIESGNRNVRQEVTKGKFTELDIKDIVRKIQSHDISVVGNFIFGLPEDNLTTMEETYQMAKELKCEWTSFYSAMAYPGSRLHDMVNEEDLPDTYTGYSQHSFDCKPTPTQYLSSAEVLKFRDEAFHRIYNDKEYVDFLRERFGQNTIDELNKILKHKLKRKLIDEGE